MAKLEVNVTFAPMYDGKPQITCELKRDDSRNLNHYVRDLIAEIPKNEKQLDALVSIYDVVNMPGGRAIFSIKQDEQNSNYTSIEDKMSVKELVQSGYDVSINLEKIRVVGYEGFDVMSEKSLAEYVDFRTERHLENVESYRQWQKKRMGE